VHEKKEKSFKKRLLVIGVLVLLVLFLAYKQHNPVIGKWIITNTVKVHSTGEILLKPGSSVTFTQNAQIGKKVTHVTYEVQADEGLINHPDKTVWRFIVVNKNSAVIHVHDDVTPFQVRRFKEVDLGKSLFFLWALFG